MIKEELLDNEYPNFVQELKANGFRHSFYYQIPMHVFRNDIITFFLYVNDTGDITKIMYQYENNDRGTRYRDRRELKFSGDPISAINSWTENHRRKLIGRLVKENVVQTDLSNEWKQATGQMWIPDRFGTTFVRIGRIEILGNSKKGFHVSTIIKGELSSVDILKAANIIKMLQNFGWKEKLS